eukprot:326847-Chlamydomonas_euryale.AAC.1
MSHMKWLNAWQEQLQDAAPAAPDRGTMQEMMRRGIVEEDRRTLVQMVSCLHLLSEGRGHAGI